MRNRDFMSDGFLALIAAGLVLLFSILLGTYLKRSPTGGALSRCFSLQFYLSSSGPKPQQKLIPKFLINLGAALPAAGVPWVTMISYPTVSSS
jgi:hypothetical protein